MSLENRVSFIESLLVDADENWKRADLNGALKAYDKALDLIPGPKMDYPITLTLLGYKADKLFKWKSFSTALEIFRIYKSHAMGANNPFIDLRIGQCITELGNYEEEGVS